MSEAEAPREGAEPRAAERTRVLLAGAGAAALAALAASRDWTSTTETGHAGITATTAQAGTDLASWALPCALAGGAAFLAMLATGNRARRVLGVVAALAGLAAGLAGALHLDAGAWPVTLAAAGLVLAAAGAATTARAGGWPAAASRYDGASRHDAGPRRDGASGGADAIAEDPVSLWNALDSGRDPSSPNITASAQEKGRS
ncbi:Trp biosynthesis-associated membrane protein [Glycomyces sp. TRM65418]|uniref:Trp biosynthesis-associated membrane protein n=1 Tax=Glycomyces sp. TRM65418 TaxID=2867006 RepID=UPI001CE5F427|nr:Trp biosynthesis-associated membrane protein [Glycomyces sp. TRM65418]MCC3762000.1 Trp biosynthesis-associated membrane protein [Glycomyces sp. TRM65418]QZD56075.1 Trp biosynthesis-associated membrane protein [Glycomyces sp. TRM65418]